MLSTSSSKVKKPTSKPRRFQQIDVAKGLAIISVILLHALEREVLIRSYAIYHIWQAVPVFLVIMGINLGMNLSGSKPEFSSLYSKTYFQKKTERIVFPVLWVYVFSVLAGLGWLLLYNQHKLEFNAYTFIGVLPVTGPGNYFITLVLQSILIFPLIDYLFKRHPSFTIVLLVALEVLFLLWSGQFRFFEEEEYLYSAALPRYFSAIAFGLVLSKAMLQPIRTAAILFFGAIVAAGCFYLYQMVYADLEISYIRSDWQTQNVLTFSYAAGFVWGLFKLLPAYSENRFLQLLATLGKASYHIFLIQIVYFGLFPEESYLLQGLLVCLLAGYLFYKVDAKYSLSFNLFK